MASGRRTSKTNVWIEAYGTVDELNAQMGHLIVTLHEPSLREDCTIIQHMLFNIGSILAKDGANYPDYPTIQSRDTRYLEHRIDQLTEELPKMTAFILPSGSESICRAHMCRTVCRRAERRIVSLGSKSDEICEIVTYINRLSDYLFTLARYLHQIQDTPEVTWSKDVRSGYPDL